jgi:hypothetical protein
VFGENADGHTTTLGGLHHQLLVHKVDIEKGSDERPDFAGAAGGPAGDRYYWHLCMSIRPVAECTQYSRDSVG